MKASVFIATSLDGYIARENGDLDWLPSGEGDATAEDHGYADFMATVDALVMGRRTYEKVLASVSGRMATNRSSCSLATRPPCQRPQLRRSNA